MNKWGQFLTVVIAGVVGTMLNIQYEVVGISKVGVYFVLFLIFGIIIEYTIRYFKSK